jgi:hypothetical protein
MLLGKNETKKAKKKKSNSGLDLGAGGGGGGGAGEMTSKGLNALGPPVLGGLKGGKPLPGIANKVCDLHSPSLPQSSVIVDKLIGLFSRRWRVSSLGWCLHLFLCSITLGILLLLLLLDSSPRDLSQKKVLPSTISNSTTALSSSNPPRSASQSPPATSAADHKSKSKSKKIPPAVPDRPLPHRAAASAGSKGQPDDFSDDYESDDDDDLNRTEVKDVVNSDSDSTDDSVRIEIKQVPQDDRHSHHSSNKTTKSKAGTRLKNVLSDSEDLPIPSESSPRPAPSKRSVTFLTERFLDSHTPPPDPCPPLGLFPKREKEFPLQKFVHPIFRFGFLP